MDNDLLFALEATTGRKKWEYPVPSGGFAAPEVAGGLVYVTAVDDGGRRPSSLYAVDAATGHVL